MSAGNSLASQIGRPIRNLMGLVAALFGLLFLGVLVRDIVDPSFGDDVVRNVGDAFLLGLVSFPLLYVAIRFIASKPKNRLISPVEARVVSGALGVPLFVIFGPYFFDPESRSNLDLRAIAFGFALSLMAIYYAVTGRMLAWPTRRKAQGARDDPAIQGNPTRHSGLGVASIVLGNFGAVTSIGMLYVLAVSTVRNWHVGAEVLGALLLVIGTGLSIGGLFQRDRKKLLAVVGLCINGGIIVIVGAFTTWVMWV